MILRTWPVSSSAARPWSPLRALLFTTVRSAAPCRRSASISSIGWPAVPKPPISTVAPSGMSATASSAADVPSRMSVMRERSLRVLEYDGQALAHSDADGRHAPTVTFGPHDLRQRAEDPAPGGTQRVPDGDGAAAGVHDLRVDAPGVHADQRLHGERL